jgi:hypothetical protein
MKRATYIAATLIVLGLYQSTAFSGDWAVEYTAKDYGTFTAHDSANTHKITGDFSRLPNGFIKQTVKESKGPSALPSGTIRYAMEIPQVGVVSQSLTKGDEGVSLAAAKGVCPKKKWEGVFVFSSWGKENDVTKSDQPVMGTFAWDPKAGTVTVPELYNLTDYEVLPDFKPFSVQGECKDGMIVFKGEGDRGGVVTLSRNQGGFYVANTGKKMVVFPKSHIRSLARVEGVYSVLNYRGLSGAMAEPGTATIAGKNGKAEPLFDVDKNTAANGGHITFSNIQLNNPVPGVFTADVATKDSPATHGACAVSATHTTFIFCTAFDPKEPKSPLHFAMRLSAPQLAKNSRK